jgi:splicing factor 3B subunit 2
MSGATVAKGKKQANKNAYRRAKKKAQRSVSFPEV